MNPKSFLSNFWGSLHFDTPSTFSMHLYRIANPNIRCVGIANPDEPFPCAFIGLQILIFAASGLQIPTNIFYASLSDYKS